MNKSFFAVTALLFSACLLPNNSDNNPSDSSKCEESTQVQVKSKLTSSKVSGGQISLPANWPNNELQMGFVWAAYPDWEAIDANAGGLSSYYTYRFMDLTWMSEAQAQGSMSEMVAGANEGGRPAHPGVVMQLFHDGVVSNTHKVDRKDVLLRKMNDPVEVSKFFKILRNL